MHKIILGGVGEGREWWIMFSQSSWGVLILRGFSRGGKGRVWNGGNGGRKRGNSFVSTKK